MPYHGKICFKCIFDEKNTSVDYEKYNNCWQNGSYNPSNWEGIFKIECKTKEQL